MTDSRGSKCLLLLVSLSIACLAAAETFPKRPNSTKSVISHVTLSDLTAATVKELLRSENPDLTLLKITNSDIGKIHRHAFDHLKHLNFLEVSETRLKEALAEDTFSRVPALEILILKKLGLTSARLNLTNVQELILSENDIAELTGDSIRGPNVDYLDLSGNGIKTLSDSLKALSKLSMIDLSKNGLQSVGANVFADNANLVKILAAENQIGSTDGLRLPNLRTLDLFQNKLSAIKSDSFRGMSFLEELVLAFNGIHVVDDPFRDLVELKFLNLAWNSISDLKPDLFRNNLYLTSLNLEGNRLTSLIRFDTTLEHLVQLDLSHNELGHVSEKFFLSLPNLSTLDLSFNNLVSVGVMYHPLKKLNVLDLSHNRLAFVGGEFARNHLLTRLNLSGNGLGIGLGSFENNPALTDLDLSENAIFKLCNGRIPLRNLRRLSVRGNRIEDLTCLSDPGFESLCVVDLRHNPLLCEMSLDDLITGFVQKTSLPYPSSLVPDHERARRPSSENLDTDLNQCQSAPLETSLRLWNSVKRELCPGGTDITLKTKEDKPQDETDGVGGDDGDDDEDDDDDDEDESFEDDDEDEDSEESQEETTTKKVVAVLQPRPNSIVVPEDLVGKRSDAVAAAVLKGDNTLQSERVSWEQIDENPDVVEDFDEQESRGHYNWYTIALVLIGISFTLTCFNLVAFLYIRLRIWRRNDRNSTQKYTFLKNEVYKNTTEPTDSTRSADSLWLSTERLGKGKGFSYERINEFFENFSGGKRLPDGESVKNVLITVPPESNANSN